MSEVPESQRELGDHRGHEEGGDDGNDADRNDLPANALEHGKILAEGEARDGSSRTVERDQ